MGFYGTGYCVLRVGGTESDVDAYCSFEYRQSENINQ